MLTIFLNQDILNIKTGDVDLVWGSKIKPNNLSTNNIYLNNTKDSSVYWSGKKEFISNSGQYSQMGFEIESTLESGNKLLYKIKLDSVSLALLNGFSNSEKIIEKLGEVSVLVVKTESIKLEDLLSISQNTNPKVVILIDETDRYEEIKQVFTQNLTLIENGYKIKPKDLAGETTQFLVLYK